MAKQNIGTGRGTRWSGMQVFSLAAISLLLGIVVGFLIRGSAGITLARNTSETASTQRVPAARALPQQNPPEVAEKAASAVLAKLKLDPGNFDLLVEAGNIYLHNRVFAGATGFYQRALAIRDDAGVRNDYARALFYSGDTEGALQQYETILRTDPKNAQALFNRGLVKWQGKQDARGAVASWKLLLAASPNEPRRAYVESLIARVSKEIR